MIVLSSFCRAYNLIYNIYCNKYVRFQYTVTFLLISYAITLCFLIVEEVYGEPCNVVLHFCFAGSGNEKSWLPSFNNESDQHCHDQEYVSTLGPEKLLATEINILMFENSV